ncbi:major facilitator superfamily domain-containing protein [Suillus paluster]|uniref:major facilitator superfamily domain-containing protein n=1 Tax=Suillus paluster TaxID=48578 RepID=UPI001B873B2D|nr:major facilitator superfamily domain-containing protein [Suillus paluster]KAG1732247.1 major facilitator superfamily domain-containing protein [Suillus paluster]
MTTQSHWHGTQDHAPFSTPPPGRVSISTVQSKLYPSTIVVADTRKLTRHISISHVEEVKQGDHVEQGVPLYRLYRRRFTGLFGFILLGLVTGMPWSWFGPISNDTSEDFDISLDQVNWLGNIICCVYIPVSLLVPLFCTRFGIRRCADVGVGMLLISGWVRYAGTITSLSSESAYALLFLGQFFSAISQPVFQVLGPKYSEMWFDLKGRTTATMIVAIANPVGSALGQLLSPLVGTPRQSVLVLAIMSTAVAPALFLIESEPPSPPTYAGSKAPQSLNSLLLAMVGKVRPSDPAYMAPRERMDFTINALIFGVLVGAANALSVLSAQYFEPEGYSDTISGLFGATLLFSGILASVIIAPLFDRVLTHHLGITLKILVPIAAGAWLSLIWVVKPNNTGTIFAIMVIIGICSIILLPVGLELGVEITRNADSSAAILWCSGNAFGIIFILAEGALRASSTASPPYNMHAAFVLHGVFVVVVGATMIFVRAKQVRREMDERMAQHLHSTQFELEAMPMDKLGTTDLGQSHMSIEKGEEESGSILEMEHSIPLPEKSAGISLEVIGTTMHRDS